MGIHYHSCYSVIDVEYKIIKLSSDAQILRKFATHRLNSPLIEGTSSITC